MAIVINSAWDAQVYQREKEEARKHINSAWDAKVFYETYGGNGNQGIWGSRQWIEKQTSLGVSYTYDPILRQWVQNSSSSIAPKLNFDSFALSEDISSLGLGDSISQSSVTSPDSDSDSKKEAEKEYIDIEFNTLTGEISVIPTKQNIKIKAGDTIQLNGVGKYLSGLYFVSEIKRTLNQDGGYTQSMTLYKNGFGEKLKVYIPSNPSDDGRPDVVDTSSNVVNTKFKIGDKVKIVGDDAVYSNAHEGVKVPDWVKSQTLVIDAISNDGQRARLNPIWSWTYIKYLQLA